MRALILLTIVATAAIVGGCGDGDASAGTGPSPTDPVTTEAKETAVASSANRGPRVKVVDSDYGRVIADGKGEAFYLFGRERGTASQCYGACAEAWPPVLAKAGGPVAGVGADQELLGTTRRKNGKLQVTYAGNPLYYYVHDTPGEILCHDVAEFGGLWLVIRPSGRPAA
jgi:predicted lipoprotein with Yx(FWY)xxD motif